MPFFILSWLLQKRRLSWSDTDSPSSSPPMVCKSSKLECCEEQHQWPYVDGRKGSSETQFFSNKNKSDKQYDETLEHKVIRWSGSRLTWVHIAPIFSPPKSGPSHKGGMAKERGSRNVLLPISPLTSRSSPAMQDSYVSSTTPFSELTRYQCQSVSLGTTSPLQEYAQTPPITMKPSNLVQQSTIQIWCKKAQPAESLLSVREELKYRMLKVLKVVCCNDCKIISKKKKLWDLNCILIGLKFWLFWTWKEST